MKTDLTDEMISMKLDSLNIRTSKEREDLFDIACWARDRMLPNNDIAELVKAYEELDENIITQKNRMPNYKRYKLENREVELRQKITELRNKLNL
jgi:DNA-binding transcriptional MerR regulator